MSDDDAIWPNVWVVETPSEAKMRIKIGDLERDVRELKDAFTLMEEDRNSWRSEYRRINDALNGRGPVDCL